MFGHFSNFDKCPPEAASDFISEVAFLDYVGVDVRVKLGDSRSNASRDIQEADFMSNEQTNERT